MCYVCGKMPLSKDEIGITKKLIDKKTTSFYSNEFKENAVNLFRREGITRTCRQLRVTRATIYRWVKRAESDSNDNPQLGCEMTIEDGNQCRCTSYGSANLQLSDFDKLATECYAFVIPDVFQFDIMQNSN